MSLKKSFADDNVSSTTRAVLTLAQHAILKSDIWRRSQSTTFMNLKIFLKDKRRYQSNRTLKDQSTASSSNKYAAVLRNLLIGLIDRVEHPLPTALTERKVVFHDAEIDSVFFNSNLADRTNKMFALIHLGA